MANEELEVAAKDDATVEHYNQLENARNSRNIKMVITVFACTIATGVMGTASYLLFKGGDLSQLGNLSGSIGPIIDALKALVAL